MLTQNEKVKNNEHFMRCLPVSTFSVSTSCSSALGTGSTITAGYSETFPLSYKSKFKKTINFFIHKL